MLVCDYPRTGRQNFKLMENKNINREDMLELTRRMTPSRTSFTRIAGCYVDKDGDFDGSFNVNFLKLSQKDKAKNLEIAKTIPFSKTNVQLKRYKIDETSREVQGVVQLLNAIKDCGLKNDALMDTLYDIIMENYSDTILPDEIQVSWEKNQFLPPEGSRIRIIPFHALGGGGLLPAFRPLRFRARAEA